MPHTTVEQRLSNLEREMEEFKQRLPTTGPQQDWIQKIAGSFQDDPEFNEILRLGREIRREDAPQPSE